MSQTEPSHKKYDLDGSQRFIEAIRSITDNPTMDKQQCEEWIELFNQKLQLPYREFENFLIDTVGKYAR